MGKETKVGLLVGMCFIVCCAIVLSHHGRRRAESTSLSVTNAERARKAPIPLDRDESAERATKRLAPKRTPAKPRREMNRPAPRRTADPDGYARQEPDRFAFAGNSTSRGETDRGNPRDADLDGPFIHRGPAIPGVVTPKPSISGNRRESNVIVLDDDAGSSDPLIANLPTRHRSDDVNSAPDSNRQMKADLHKLTSTPNPIPADTKSQMTTESNRETAPQTTERGFEVPQFQKNNRTPGINRREQARKAAMDRHVVQEGEHLSKIAYQYYGSSEQRILDAIVKANHETMSSRDYIIAGQSLLLPDIDDIDLQGGDDSAFEETREADGKNTVPVEEEVADAPQPTGFTEYTVQPGDLLSRIVARHYGRSTSERVDTVFNANRDVMKHRDHLQAGMTLRIPNLPGGQNAKVETRKARPTNERGASNRKQTGSSKAETKPTFRWYQVKKGDAYSTIAAREMGSSKRWKELAEFNKDIFESPNLLRHGVNIRIPTTLASTQQGGVGTRGG